MFIIESLEIVVDAINQRDPRDSKFKITKRFGDKLRTKQRNVDMGHTLKQNPYKQFRFWRLN